MKPLTLRQSLYALLVLLAGSLPTTGCSSGVAYDLRGPGSMIGQVYNTEHNVTMTNGTMTLSRGGRSESCPCQMTMNCIDVEETLATEKGQVTQTRTKVARQESRETVRVEGKEDTRTETSSLQGETVECAKVGGEWKITLVGKTPNQKQARELKEFPTPDLGIVYYPAAPVRPGHKWTVDVSKLKKMMGSKALIDSGNCKMLFERTTDVDGELCALLTQEMQMQGKIPNEQGESARVEMKVAGSSLRSLIRGFTLSSRLTGTMTFSETLTLEGQKVEMKITGPITIETKTQKK